MSEWARAAGVSAEAAEIYSASDVIDLHIDTFIWARVLGYDLTKRHGRGLTGARFFGQVDLPRIREARISGGIWSITTNPLRDGGERGEVFANNLERLRDTFASVPHTAALVRTHAEYVAAKERGLHAAFIGVQGGNALDGDLDAIEAHKEWLLRVTLVHLSSSKLGATSSPLSGKGDGALSALGRSYVERLNAARIFVDLAHISRRGFFDAVSVHDKSQPLIVTHTGVAGVYEHWRNVTDAQLRAVADTGGTVGVMYHSGFLGDPLFSGRAETIVAHLAHIVATVGEDHASLGSDWDGMILTPRDMPTCLELPRLVDRMLARGWRAERIQKILGRNFLRALRMLRP